MSSLSPCNPLVVQSSRPSPPLCITMNSSIAGRSLALFCFGLITLPSLGQSVFPDKKLEAAVRKEVFEKRNNQEPITAEDVKRISQVITVEHGITSLEGLQHCEALMRIDLAGHEIVDLAPLANLKRLQSIDLSNNKIVSIEPLKDAKNVQYLKLSNNQIEDIAAVSAMSNMRALYLEGNKIKSLEPIAGLAKITSLYAGGNPIENYAVIGNLPWLSSLDLQQGNISDLHFLMPLQQVKSLNLAHNKIKDLSALLEMCRADLEDRRRFAPYLRLYVEDNAFEEPMKSEQFTKLKEAGVHVFDGSEKKPLSENTPQPKE